MYVEALRLLARRELSEAQLRQRLERRGHTDPVIDEAIARLRHAHAVDDVRAAEAIARCETAGKGRGRIRARLALQRAGIDREAANRALDEVFQAVDADKLLEDALAKRLRPGASIEDERQLYRLYRYLVARGFDPDDVRNLLERRRR